MSTTGPNDYGIATDYRPCADCGTSRPVSALVKDGNPDGLRVCEDREWCVKALVQRAVEADRARLFAAGYPVWLQMLDAVKRAHGTKQQRGRR